MDLLANPTGFNNNNNNNNNNIPIIIPQAFSKNDTFVEYNSPITISKPLFMNMDPADYIKDYGQAERSHG